MFYEATTGNRRTGIGMLSLLKEEALQIYASSQHSVALSVEDFDP